MAVPPGQEDVNMSRVRRSVPSPYGVGGVLDSSLRSRAEISEDLNSVTPSEFTPLDAFHIRGRDATVERTKFAQWP